MKYTSITFVNVERAFSMYKNILTLNKISFTENNLIKYIAVNSFFMYNSNFFFIIKLRFFFGYLKFFLTIYFFTKSEP